MLAVNSVLLLIKDFYSGGAKMFKLGDMVRWQSQAAGSQTEKVGKVVRILSKNDTPSQVASAEFQNHRRMFDGWSIPGPENQTVGYLVEVRDGKTDKATPKLYMPYPSKLSAA